MLLSGATPLFKRGRPPELPKANYPLVFRSQNSYRRSFLILGNPEKSRLSVKFSSYATFRGRPTLPEADYPPVSRTQNSYRRFFDLGQPRKKAAFPSSFPLMLLSGATPLFKRGRPPELPEANYSLRFPIKSLHRKKSVL